MQGTLGLSRRLTGLTGLSGVFCPPANPFNSMRYKD